MFYTAGSACRILLPFIESHNPLLCTNAAQHVFLFLWRVIRRVSSQIWRPLSRGLILPAIMLRCSEGWRPCVAMQKALIQMLNGWVKHTDELPCDLVAAETGLRFGLYFQYHLDIEKGNGPLVRSFLGCIKFCTRGFGSGWNGIKRCERISRHREGRRSCTCAVTPACNGIHCSLHQARSC